MKNLIFINGTAGVGKTTTGKQLKKLLPNCVFLDGDWCWDASPFVVTDETKNMVLDNIGHLLNNFLACSAYKNVVFCWVMHEESIIYDIISMLESKDYCLYQFSLVCSAQSLTSRISKDIENGVRETIDIERNIARLQNYYPMDTKKIDVNDITAESAAQIIKEYINTADI